MIRKMRRLLATMVAITLMAWNPLGAASQDARFAGSQISFYESGDHEIVTLSDRARLHVEEVTPAEALGALRDRSGLQLLFSPSLLPDDVAVTCECGDLTIRDALGLILDGTGFELLQERGHVLVAPQPPGRVSNATSGSTLPGKLPTVLPRIDFPLNASPRTLPVSLQGGTISGRVLASRSLAPLSGVQVSLPELDLGALSDAGGRFILDDVPAGTHQVRAARIGYRAATEEVTVRAGETTTVELLLSEQALDLDEIVITGTAGQARRREVGHSIGQIDLGPDAQPGANLEHLLAAQVPGLTMLQSSGQTGSGGQIRLRGNVSVTQSNQPLIYVDGVRVMSDPYPRIRQRGGSGFAGNNDVPTPLGDINPADIQRIEVIKGAAATTLYGMEAASGVIQIFTKRGTSDRAVWAVSTDQSFDRVQKFGPPNEPYFRIDPWLRTGWNQRYTASVSGRSGPDFDYFVSGSLEDNRGVLPNELQDRFITRANFAFAPHPTLNLRWNTTYTHNDLQNTAQGNTAVGLTLNAFRGDANYFGVYDKEVIDQVLDAEITRKTGRLATGMTFEYTPRERLTNRLVLGLDRTNSDMRMLQPHGYFITPDGVLTQLAWSNNILSADYVGSLGRLELGRDLRATVSWGGQSVSTETVEMGATVFGLPGPGVPTLSSGASSFPYETRMRVVNAGLFGQALFDLRDRYFLTLGLRVDGNSALGENLGLQSYPKATFSYVISEEEFWPAGLGEVKLRGAYGHAGRAPGAFDAVRTWQPEPWLGEVAFDPSQVGNPDLGPERTSETEVGFDAGLLDGRLNLTVTYYRQKTRDALFPVSQTPSMGFTSSQVENVGELSNSGLEVGVDGALIERPTWAWDAGVNLTSNKSEVVTLGRATSFGVGSSGRIELGHPAPVMVGRRIRNPDELAEPDIELDHIYGPNQPTLVLALRTSVTLPRGVRLAARGEYMGGHYIQDSGSGQMANRAVWPLCENEYQLLAEGRRDDLSARQRALCDRTLFQTNMLIYPADFFRLREVTISVPVDFAVPRASTASLALSARNYWTWTNKDFLAFDPEMVGQQGAHQFVRNMYEHIPPPATITASLRVIF